MAEAAQATRADVTVLGAGIAGLAVAIACAIRGHRVEIIEQAPALTEIGAGLQIAPNGARVLEALGVPIPGPRSTAVHLIDGPSGRRVLRMPLEAAFFLVHRADLIAALADRAVSVGVDIHLGRRVRGIAEGRLLSSDGAHPFTRLVGADGARGASRAQVAPEHQGRFTGQVAWRALVPVSDWPREAQVHMGPGRHLVCYPLRDGRMLNIVAVEERSGWVAEGWSQEDDPENLRRAFADYATPIRAVLAQVERVHLWGLMDHGLTSCWHRDGITLIGDAAHPTLPFLAQGANLALEDAWLLARHLDDPASYEAMRRPRVARALRAARGNARNYHLRGVSRRAAHAVLRIADRVAPRAPLRGLSWLYDFDVTAEADAPASSS